MKCFLELTDSPPISEPVAAPPKKRRLPRESLSNNNSPPTTPTQTTAPPLPEDTNKSAGSDEGRVEIVYSGTDGDSPTQVLESDAVLKERFVINQFCDWICAIFFFNAERQRCSRNLPLLYVCLSRQKWIILLEPGF